MESDFICEFFCMCIFQTLLFTTLLASQTLLYCLTLCILMDFSIQMNAIRMGLPVIYFKGSQIEIS